MRFDYKNEPTSLMLYQELAAIYPWHLITRETLTITILTPLIGSLETTRKILTYKIFSLNLTLEPNKPNFNCYFPYFTNKQRFKCVFHKITPKKSCRKIPKMGQKLLQQPIPDVFTICFV